ncbi:MAG TPA: ABC transporter permease, partial [Streptosporangiaceae bacterium]
MKASALRSLSRAMYLGFVRDRTALLFTILIPVLFLVLFGSIYKSSGTPKVSIIEVGRVALLNQAEAAAPGQLGKVLSVTHSADLSGSLDAVRKGNDDAVVQQQGRTLVVHYSIADQTKAGVVQAVFGSIVQQADAAAAGRSAGYQLSARQVEDTSLKPIQYLAPGLLGWAIASGGAFGAAITLVNWRQTKLLRRLR